MTENNVITEYIFPKSVPYYENAENVAALTNTTELQITLVEPRLTLIRKGGFVVIDFGRELAGGVRILTKTSDGKLRLRLGESVSETCSNVGEHGSTNDHALRDGEFYVPGLSDTFALTRSRKIRRSKRRLPFRSAQATNALASSRTRTSG